MKNPPFENNESSQTSKDSLGKRYFYKVFVNFINLIFNIGIQWIIPRGLGPKNYGDFNFMTNSFTQLIGFCEMGSSTAFFTKLSQRQRESALLSFYFLLSIFISFAIFLFIACCHISCLYTKIWPDQDAFFLYLAAGYSLLIWFSQVLSQSADALGLTVKAEIFKAYQKILSLLLIGALFFFHKLTMTIFFIYNYTVLSILVIGYFYVIKASGCFYKQWWNISKEGLIQYFSEYHSFCHPLFAYSLVSLIVGISDRWFLQLFGGSNEQGFYSLSYQLCSISFIFTGAMTPLLLREFSIAHSNNDKDRMLNLYQKLIPPLFSLSAFFACFFTFQAKNITIVFGGKEYSGAITSLSIMSFYPIVQTLGQLSATLFFATSQTALYRSIGIFFMLLGIPVTFFLLAPHKLLGIEAGATGLALKTIILSFVTVYALIYSNTRLLKISFTKIASSQFSIILLFIVLSFVSSTGISHWIGSSIHPLVHFCISGLIYFFCVTFIFCLYPMFFGIDKNDINNIIYRFMHFSL